MKWKRWLHVMLCQRELESERDCERDRERNKKKKYFKTLKDISNFLGGGGSPREQYKRGKTAPVAARVSGVLLERERIRESAKSPHKAEKDICLWRIYIFASSLSHF